MQKVPLDHVMCLVWRGLPHYPLTPGRESAPPPAPFLMIPFVLPRVRSWCPTGVEVADPHRKVMRSTIASLVGLGRSQRSLRGPLVPLDRLQTVS